MTGPEFIVLAIVALISALVYWSNNDPQGPAV